VNFVFIPFFFQGHEKSKHAVKLRVSIQFNYSSLFIPPKGGWTIVPFPWIHGKGILNIVVDCLIAILF